MAKIQPWYKVVTPREDLREGKPLDASEFAVHLDQVRDGQAKEDYQNPARFFDRTYLTKNLTTMAVEVVRRLAGETTGANAVFNMSTQFGGGKTHALTLLYHLASNGSGALRWTGVSQIASQAEVQQLPLARPAVFVGTEFDSIAGRGGDDGTPHRFTPWGEIAWQLSREEGFKAIEQHDRERTAPAGEVIRKFLPKDRPCIILIDELLNYVSRNRKSGLSSQLYNFIHNLSEVSRGVQGMVLVVSVPASELEMTAEDQSDFDRFKKMLDRVGKPMVMSAEAETSEIIRRRLFEWDPRAVSANGRVLLPKEAIATCGDYADWLAEHRSQIPSWFSVDHARSLFESTYPFHPMTISVFERKWQALPRFQQTRGVLRLLALWVSHVYREGFKGARREPLIDLGSAPLDDPLFRAAVFEQLGEQRLEGAVTTDITGKKDSHAIRLDEEAVDTVRKLGLHKKIATTIFFESNGGHAKVEATVPEIRLAVGSPELDLGHLETALEGLTDACYYLVTERNRYRFNLKENLNKRFADRKASIKGPAIADRIGEEIQKVFPSANGVERIFFPEKSAQIPDRPAVTLIIMGLEDSLHDNQQVKSKIESMTREHGSSARTYKSALIWVIPESDSGMKEEARKLLAWEDIQAEKLKLDDSQQKQLDANIKKARRDLIESVWRAYKNIFLLGKDNQIEKVDLGLVTSSQAESLPKLILSHLRQKDIIQKEVAPRFLVRNWPAAFQEWTTKSVRDAFYASPLFPRLLDSESVKTTIARGVSEGHIAYATKSPQGGYKPILFEKAMNPSEVEISDDIVILTAEEARKHLEPPRLEKLELIPNHIQMKPGHRQSFRLQAFDQFGTSLSPAEITWHATGGLVDSDGVFTAGEDEGNFVITAASAGKSDTASVHIIKESEQQTPQPSKPTKLSWAGNISAQKWTNFYMKVLTKLVTAGPLQLQVSVEASPKGGVSDQHVEEIRAALRELGLDDEVKTKA